MEKKKLEDTLLESLDSFPFEREQGGHSGSPSMADTPPMPPGAANRSNQRPSLGIPDPNGPNSSDDGAHPAGSATAPPAPIGGTGTLREATMREATMREGKMHEGGMLDGTMREATAADASIQDATPHGVAGAEKESSRSAPRDATQPEAFEQIAKAEQKFELIKDSPPTVPDDIALPRSGSTDVARAFEVFRPRHRPPMAVLSVVDDGSQSAERFRLRGDRFVIGRTDGDLVIPHDSGISGRHCEFVRLVEEGAYIWQMRDLNSRNGTFASVASFRLRDGQELLIGVGRFRFEAGTPNRKALDETHVDPNKTQGAKLNVTGQWQPFDETQKQSLTPRLVELTNDGDGRAFPLEETGTVIGGRPDQCNLAIDSDPYVEPTHCRIFKENKRWRVENLSTTNGTWLRLESINIDSFGAFQCGEQRFTLRVK